MTESLLPDLTPQEVHDRVAVAMQYAHDMGAVHDRDMLSLAEDGSLDSATINLSVRNAFLSYKTKTTEQRVTHAVLNETSSGNYSVGLISGPNQSAEIAGSRAVVVRANYGRHEFSEPRRVRAATLITSLARKYVEEAVDDHVETIVDSANVALAAQASYAARAMLSELDRSSERLLGRTTKNDLAAFVIDRYSSNVVGLAGNELAAHDGTVMAGRIWTNLVKLSKNSDAPKDTILESNRPKVPVNLDIEVQTTKRGVDTYLSLDIDGLAELVDSYDTFMLNNPNVKPGAVLCKGFGNVQIDLVREYVDYKRATNVSVDPAF